MVLVRPLLFCLLALVLLTGCARHSFTVLPVADPLALDGRVLVLGSAGPGHFRGSWTHEYRTPIIMPYSLAQLHELFVGVGSRRSWLFTLQPTGTAPQELSVSVEWLIVIRNSSARYEITAAVPDSVVLELIGCDTDGCRYAPQASAGLLDIVVDRSGLPQFRSGWPGPLARFTVEPTLQVQLAGPDTGLGQLVMELTAGAAHLVLMR